MTLVILMLAFGSLVAAGLPLMLTILGLVASAGTLYLGTKFFDISIWAMNFALMFALALGIDYALFIVHRFRGAFFGSKLTARDAVAVTMDTAGQGGALLRRDRSHLALRGDARAEPGVPLDGARDHGLGRLRPARVADVAARSARQARTAGRPAGAEVGALRASTARRRSPPGPSACGAVRGCSAPRPSRSWLRSPCPCSGSGPACRRSRSCRSRTTSRQGYELVQSAFGEGAPGALQLVGPAAEVDRAVAVVKADPGIARVMPAQKGAGGLVLVQAIPDSDPSSPAVGATIDRLRAAVPTGVLVGGATAENHDLEQVLAQKTPLVIGVVLVLGFLLLLLALQAPVIAAVGVVTNLLAVGAAFGVARLIFQDGHGAGLLGFESQGFIDAWGPVFFFAMIFAISMDYTVFLLSSAKEHYDRTHDPRDAMVGGLAHSGRVIFAAAARDGRGVLHVRALRAAAAQGDGRHPRRRRAARRAPDPARPRARGAAAPRHLGLGPAALARPNPPGRHVRALLNNRESKGSPMDVTTATFEQEVIERSREHPVVVDFWADWCGPCRALAPAIESEVAKRSEQILLAKVDVDAETAIAARYGIQSIPTVAVFANGEPVTGFVGAQPAPAIGRFLDGVIAEHAGPVEAA